MNPPILARISLAALLSLCCTTGAAIASRTKLTPVASGFSQITDLQFVPGRKTQLVVLQKEGKAVVVDLASGKRATILDLPVTTASEQGLLGLAFHPRFAENRRVYVNYTAREDGEVVTRIAEFTLAAGELPGAATNERILLRQVQPYPNHDGGQVLFGPDGMLYIGLGDGGSGGDPQGNGQKTSTFLGKMLRIDVDRRDPGKEYAVPPDNPFVGRQGFLPEIWLYGLRNPWRFSWDAKARLVIADVGQNRYEEVDVALRGENLGWNVREGFHCFDPPSGCRTEGLVDPVFEYGRDLGQSITGGYVYQGSRVPSLKGKYVFTDFVSGQLWAIDLPDPRRRVTAGPIGATGRSVATFGRDADGELYLGDFSSGEVLRLDGAGK